MFQYEAKMMRVVDGDTVWLNIDLGFRIHVEVDVRLAYINAPELVNYNLTGLRDLSAGYIAKCIPPGAACVVEISRAEKFGRWLGVLHFLPGSSDRTAILAGGRVLNDELVREGLAKRYKP